MKAKRSKVFKPVTLSLVVSGLMYGISLPQAQANDLDIYRPAIEGQTTLLLMFDTSGSMGWGSGYSNTSMSLQGDYGICSGSTANVKSITSTTTPSYTQYFCEAPSSTSSNTIKTQCTLVGSTYRCFDRLTRLKDAIFELMDSTAIKDSVVMGLAQYSTQSNSANTAFSADGVSGKIVVPARPLNAAQRLAIKQAAATFVAWNGTPSAHAYAEAAAYMMGTSTRSTATILRDEYRWLASTSRFNLCTAWSAINYTTNRQACSTWSSTNLTSQPSVPVVSTESRVISNATYSVYLSSSNQIVPNTGSGFENSVASSKNGANYVSPLPTDTSTLECNGQGIYFLTDGEPNASNNANSLMSLALKGSFSSSGGLPDGSQSGHASPATGAFSKYLFNKTNPAGVQIKTAVVGFGTVFASLTKQPLPNPDTGKNRDYYDCRTGTNVDARNACNWGEKTHPQLPNVGGFGQGGFYYASGKTEIVNSVVSFIDELQENFPSVPTGTMVVPQDTLARNSLQPFAYLPLLDPKPNTSTVVWPGNVKKYNVKNSTIEGKDKQPVFTSEGVFTDNTYDLWSITNTADKGEIQIGGAFERLPMPTSTNTLTRNVWLDRGAGSKVLDQIKPTVQDMNALTGVTNWQRRYLLNFMGFDLPELASLTDLANVLPTTLTRPVEPFRVMGGVVHSTPQLLTYSANINANGSLSSTRDESLLFGSLEGALHVVNASTGVEQMAFIPRQILDNQARALRPDTIGRLSPDKTATPAPTAFGVDAPWEAYAEYSRKPNKIQADFIYAYGGLRMGGDAFYGLNLTNRNSPSILFSIAPSTSGFSRLGQTWGRPVVTRMRHNNQTKLVVIISGGYDLRYEDPVFNPSSSTEMQGNAIYILDAKTGERLLTVGRTGADLNNANMRHSVVGRVKTLDRDADGLADHIYFADLGGQVFRVDLQNAPKTSVANFGTRVVRLANLSAANGTGTPPPRFYEAPLVTLHDAGSKRFGLINVGSGDRSNPLYDANTPANRIYGIIDRDLARTDLYSATVSMNSQNIELTSLIEKPTTAAHKAAMLSDGVDRMNGWYFPLEGYGSIKFGLKGLKAFNEGAAISNVLYMSVYNPNVTNNGANKCSAQVLGGTELHQYCLPFGTCAPQRFALGQGIQAVNIGPGADPESRVVLFQTDPLGKNGGLPRQNLEGPDSDLFQHDVPPGLVPIRWYEKQPKLKP